MTYRALSRSRTPTICSIERLKSDWRKLPIVKHVASWPTRPLGFGVLSGKYLNSARPAGARLTLYARFDRYSNPHAEKATQDYVEPGSRVWVRPGADGPSLGILSIVRHQYDHWCDYAPTTRKQSTSLELQLPPSLLAEHRRRSTSNNPIHAHDAKSKTKTPSSLSDHPLKSSTHETDLPQW